MNYLLSCWVFNDLTFDIKLIFFYFFLESHDSSEMKAGITYVN